MNECLSVCPISCVTNELLLDSFDPNGTKLGYILPLQIIKTYHLCLKCSKNIISLNEWIVSGKLSQSLVQVPVLYIDFTDLKKKRQMNLELFAVEDVNGLSMVRTYFIFGDHKNIFN